MGDPYRGQAQRLRDLESGPPTSPQRRRRTTLLVILALLGLVLIGAVFVGVDSRSALDVDRQAGKQGSLTLTLGDEPLVSKPVDALEAAQARDELIAGLPRRERVRRAGARITVEVDRGATRARLEEALAGNEAGTVSIVAQPVASSQRLPIVKQALRNNCETAALSMLLATEGIKADQLDLQRRLPSDGPLDPETDGARLIWGDPDRGFVGRPEGGGTSGGYGVYQGPITALAEKEGASLIDLSGQKPKAIYERVLDGRPVMAWVGLADGPYETWTTPEGKDVTGNFGEHTVVLTGIDGDSISVNDPLVGVRTTWTRAEFETMWERLERRALSI